MQITRCGKNQLIAITKKIFTQRLKYDLENTNVYVKRNKLKANERYKTDVYSACSHNYHEPFYSQE